MIFAFTVLTLIGLILIGVLPIWPFSRGWGYGPAVVIGIVFLMLLVMTLTRRVPGIGDTQRSMTVACSSKASLQQAIEAVGVVASEAERHCDQLQFAAALFKQEHRAIEDDRSALGLAVLLS